MYQICLFKSEVFDGLVSLHTLHHLPRPSQRKAYTEFYRTLKLNRAGVVVNGWTDSSLMHKTRWLVGLMEQLGNIWAKLCGGKVVSEKQDKATKKEPTGTYIQKLDAETIEQDLERKCFV